MHEFLIGAIGAVGVPLVLLVWQFLLKRERVRQWGRVAGGFCRVFLRQRVGVIGGDKLVERLVSTVSDFVEGVYLGLRGDAVK